MNGDQLATAGLYRCLGEGGRGLLGGTGLFSSPGGWFPWAAREDSAAPAPRDSDSGLTVAASSSSLLGQVRSPRLTPSPFSGFIHIAHTLPAFLTFTAGRDVHCLGLYLALEPLTPIHKPQGSSSGAHAWSWESPLPGYRTF